MCFTRKNDIRDWGFSSKTHILSKKAILNDIRDWDQSTFKLVEMLHQDQWQFSCHHNWCKVTPVLQYRYI